MAVGKTRSSSNKSTPLPTIGRQGPAGNLKKNAASAKGKEKEKGNGNILSFFKREEAGLFVQDSRAEPVAGDVDSPVFDQRFNEDETPSKRRRLSNDTNGAVPDPATAVDSPLANKTSLNLGTVGPFVEDSDSEDGDEEQLERSLPIKLEQDDIGPPNFLATAESTNKTAPTKSNGPSEAVVETAAEPPPLIKHETSHAAEYEGFNDFEGMEGDFDEDLFEGGDEFLERRYMEEQAQLEAIEAEGSHGISPWDIDNKIVPDDPTTDHAPACPICSRSLAGLSEQDVGVHVNNCLDGNPTPSQPAESPPAQTKPNAASSGPPQFKRPARPPRPAQQNPFTLGQPSGSGGTAFNKLMSGHAEDAAWAEAAAAENAGRGKPFYQRICPFYKIMPGLSICVDAFRYGAVAGCQAYFLSHFHSDHYIGLTSSWNHGPIYCSRVTGNLVRQQLRVDPKYVVDLDFEDTTDVPGTNGVRVTMISANHCPGSSLFLFEKTVGKKANGQPRLQRILHCGDFRACTMHVQHPLLMPNVQDQITGKTTEQKIDVCYLDTTYLNPRYAFPSQENVITACAEMCVCLSKVTPDESDGWEQMKRQRAGEGMAKFVKRESTGGDADEEPTDDATANDVKVEANPHADQQILSSTATQKGRGRLLVVVGTYSIGKERICLGIAKALDSKIYAPPSKQRIVAALEDTELNARMTSDPRAAQVHMTPLFEIRAETLDDYLKDYFPHFTRAVGFRPSGWNYRPPNSRFTESPSVQTVLHGDNWKSSYGMRDLAPQRGSTGRASCFGVPYSEHSSFRELTMFCCALRIDRVIPTVNVGSAKGRDRMKAWIERWATERKKNGLYPLPEDGSW